MVGWFCLPLPLHSLIERTTRDGLGLERPLTLLVAAAVALLGFSRCHGYTHVVYRSRPSRLLGRVDIMRSCVASGQPATRVVTEWTAVEPPLTWRQIDHRRSLSFPPSSHALTLASRAPLPGTMNYTWKEGRAGLHSDAMHGCIWQIKSSPLLVLCCI